MNQIQRDTIDNQEIFCRIAALPRYHPPQSLQFPNGSEEHLAVNSYQLWQATALAEGYASH